RRDARPRRWQRGRTRLGRCPGGPAGTEPERPGQSRGSGHGQRIAGRCGARTNARRGELMRGRARVLLMLLTAAAATGCAVGPNYRTPQLPLPEHFVATPAADASAAPHAPPLD